MGASYSSQEPACSVPVEPSTSPEYGPIYINSIRIRENGSVPIATFRCSPEAQTTIDILKTVVGKWPNLDGFGERIVNPDGSFGDYQWISWKEFMDMALAFAAGLKDIGVSKGDTVGIYSYNCLHWQITQFACHFIGAILVPVYDSLGPNAASYIVHHAECKLIVTHPTKLEASLKLIGESDTPLKSVILIANEPIPDHPEVLASRMVLEKGKQIKEFVPYSPLPEDDAIIMYTSGSTGVPKGCVLTHKSIVAGATGLGAPGCSITTSDTYYSFLPLAHIYELCSQICFMNQGVRMGFFSGSTQNLVSDLAALQPTCMLGVPRVFNKLYEKMKTNIDKLPAPKRMLVRWALKSKNDALMNDKPHSLFIDMVLFKAFRQALGGRIRLIVSGGAPILPEVYEFLRAAITPNILQGYGLTEVCAAGCLQEIGSKNPSAVGCISLPNDLRLRKVEGMDYDPNGKVPAGEIMFRGPSLFKCYHKDPKLTEDSLVDGWFATGDIGMMTSDGSIQIIDRAKQLVKLSQGEYISITSLTDKYGLAKGVANIYVYADSHHNLPIAVVIPTNEQAEEWKKKGIEDYTVSPIAVEDMMTNLGEIVKQHNLRGFEKMGAVLLDSTEFSIENGLLTPSQKPQLSKLRNKYESRLIELYNKNPRLLG